LHVPTKKEEGGGLRKKRSTKGKSTSHKIIDPRKKGCGSRQKFGGGKFRLKKIQEKLLAKKDVAVSAARGN